MAGAVAKPSLAGVAAGLLSVGFLHAAASLAVILAGGAFGRDGAFVVFPFWLALGLLHHLGREARTLKGRQVSRIRISFESSKPRLSYSDRPSFDAWRTTRDTLCARLQSRNVSMIARATPFRRCSASV